MLRRLGEEEVVGSSGKTKATLVLAYFPGFLSVLKMFSSLLNSAV